MILLELLYKRNKKMTIQAEPIKNALSEPFSISKTSYGSGIIGLYVSATNLATPSTEPLAYSKSDRQLRCIGQLHWSPASVIQPNSNNIKSIELLLIKHCAVHNTSQVMVMKSSNH